MVFSHQLVRLLACLLEVQLFIQHKHSSILALSGVGSEGGGGMIEIPTLSSALTGDCGSAAHQDCGGLVDATLVP